MNHGADKLYSFVFIFISYITVHVITNM